MFTKDFEDFGKTPVDPLLWTPLAMAFAGDSVFDLYIRTRIVLFERTNPKYMQQHASHFAKASSQARMLQLILEDLTDEEASIVRRARNTHVNTVAKHAERNDYMLATGFEALIGWLYLTGKEERLHVLLALAMDRFEKWERNGEQEDEQT